MAKVLVQFEESNLLQTLAYIRQKQSNVNVINVSDKVIKSKIKEKIKIYLSDELRKWGFKGYRFFEHLNHFPIENVLSCYTIGNSPMSSVETFEIDVEGQDDIGDIVVHLYVYLSE